MPHLADEYILGSNGNIHTVIGIKLDHKKTNEVTLSIRQPQIIRNDAGEDELVAVQVVVDQVFS